MICKYLEHPCSSERVLFAGGLRRLRLMAGVAVASVAASGACTDSTVAPAHESARSNRAPPTAQALRLDTLPPVVAGEPDLTFLALSKAHPGFAGAWFEDGQLYIGSTSGQVPAGFSVASLGVETAAALTPRRVQHTFEDLARWYGPFIKIVAAQSGPTTTDIDERRNRLVAEVVDVAGTKRALQRGGIPSSVYEVRALRRASGGLPATPSDAASAPDTTECSELDDKCRPVIGGLEINRTNGGTCTLGFNIDHHEWGAAFVTASHCSQTTGGGTGTVYYQGGGRVGVEVYDMPKIPKDSLPPGVCPRDYCRFSDALVAQYDDGVSNTLGHIADLTTGTQVDSTPWVIEQEDHDLLAGEPVFFIGRTSGEVETEVDAICKNRKLEVDDGPDIEVLCQYQYSEPPEGGDSGGPVFKRLGPESGNGATLVGISWLDFGWFLDYDGVFSGMRYIPREIGEDSALDCGGIETTYGGGCDGVPIDDPPGNNPVPPNPPESPCEGGDPNDCDDPNDPDNPNDPGLQSGGSGSSSGNGASS